MCHVESEVGQDQSSAGKVEEHHLGEATHRAEDGALEFPSPSCRRAGSKFLCCELGCALEKARRHEQASGWTTRHELPGVDVVKAVRGYDVFDNAKRIDRGQKPPALTSPATSNIARGTSSVAEASTELGASSF